MQEAVAAVARAQPVQQFQRIAALGGPQCGGVPLGALAVRHGHEGGLAAHRQAHVHVVQMVVELGLVTRGDSNTRVTSMVCVNSTSATSTAPVTGAALPGSGVAASGMWPSPASRPEVGSSPIQPAPGR
ncbi:hypothetical protein G6F66_014674 [Rhizopus arrhizus]|nr:hypothetical protein G6F66_014674 [Rhizopus arrhizus]